ncbi:MAG: LysO family transporter [Bacteroidaceae bacterium]|nr:LysO family transporter [Bacteroidaceae bacterium]
MLIVIAMMFSGIAFGYIMRSRKINGIHKVITMLVWALLFVLGVEVGGNPRIIAALPTLGIEALFIATLAILGSAIAAMLLWKSTKEKNKDKEEKK